MESKKESFKLLGPMLILLILLIIFIGFFIFTVQAEDYLPFETKTVSEFPETNDDLKSNISQLFCRHDNVISYVIPSTCSNPGSQRDICQTCGKVLIEKPLALKEHQWIYKEEKSATCSEEGICVQICSECGAKGEKMPIKKLPHRLEAKVVTEATCQNDGLMEYNCLDCKQTIKTEIIPSYPHTLDSRIVSESTCMTAGIEEYYCTVCNEVMYQNKLPLADHCYKQSSYSPATPFSNGYKTYSCVYCGASYTEDIYFDNHRPYIHIPNAGLTAYVYVGENSQTACDNNDVVVTFSVMGYDDPVAFGHNTRSFGRLQYSHPGDTIYLNTPEKGLETYTIIASEVAVDNESGTDMTGVYSGQECLDYLGSPALHIYTCHTDPTYGKCRWMVVAVKS